MPTSHGKNVFLHFFFFDAIFLSCHSICHPLKPVVPNHSPHGFICGIYGAHEFSASNFCSPNLVPCSCFLMLRKKLKGKEGKLVLYAQSTMMVISAQSRRGSGLEKKVDKEPAASCWWQGNLLLLQWCVYLHSCSAACAYEDLSSGGAGRKRVKHPGCMLLKIFFDQWQCPVWM